MAKSYKLDNLLPILLSLCGFVLTCVAPIKLAFDGKTTEISYLDGKGILAAIFISILTVELYRIMREKNFGRIKYRILCLIHFLKHLLHYVLESF